MDVLPIGAKSENNEVVGVAATNSGEIKTIKTWKNEMVDFFVREAQLVHGTNVMNDDAVSSGRPGLDVSDAAAVSLYIQNDTEYGFTLKAYAPVGTSNYQLYDKDGNWHQFEVARGLGSRTLITPDDWNILQWLPRLKLAIDIDSETAVDVNGSGQDVFKIYAIVKR